MSYTPLFANRTDAGEKLAQKIHTLLSLQAITSGVKPLPIVYALPRGGLPVAAPVAHLLGCPLSIIVAKKISHQCLDLSSLALSQPFKKKHAFKFFLISLLSNRCLNFYVKS
jgi:putative phosphoribosyl transferase